MNLINQILIIAYNKEKELSLFNNKEFSISMYVFIEFYDKYSLESNK